MGYLDAQFVELEELQDDSNPHFVEEILTMFFRDSVRVIDEIAKSLEQSPLDFETLDKQMQKFKGSSASIGAAKIREETVLYGDFCKQGNAEGCQETFDRVKKECKTLKSKFEIYFQLARQLGPAETASRPL